VEKSEAELKERIVALEACEEDLRQRLEDRDQAHAWIQAKLQVRRTSGRGWKTGIKHMPGFRLSFR
jgi:hypothetical protein